MGGPWGIIKIVIPTFFFLLMLFNRQKVFSVQDKLNEKNAPTLFAISCKIFLFTLNAIVIRRKYSLDMYLYRCIQMYSEGFKPNRMYSIIPESC